MFDSLLIANRGEIALRIIRTCRRMGIRALAIWSDADRDAPFVAAADAAMRIGPGPATGSYLKIDAIIDAARRLGADAIHPGYGFLAENPDFAEACAQHDIVFVGPSAGCIRQMGSKIEAKALAGKLGVPLLPGYADEQQSDDALIAAAGEIGAPLLIKASAGGGGRGMRLVENLDEFDATLGLVRNEATAAFGDGAVLLEKYVESPRHLEVQLLGDKHGNLIHLHDRDCSIQRHHQKIIEEAPAPGLGNDVRDGLRRHALAIGRAIGYDSAGTVEFVADTKNNETYFLEMNTRLQVEHTVTEMITGLDLVELQIRIAAGDALPLSQDNVNVDGSAIEARVYAEDPARSYLPQNGTIELYREPETTGLRVDSGVAEGSAVTSYYDPMLAKVVAWGSDREAAVRRLAAGLQGFQLAGTRSNLAFVHDLVAHPDFAAARLTTRFIELAFPDGWHPESVHRQTDIVAAATLQILRIERENTGPGHNSPWKMLGPWRLVGRAGFPGVTRILLADMDDERWSVEVEKSGDGYRVVLEGAAFDVRAIEINDTSATLQINETERRYGVRMSGDRIVLACGQPGSSFRLLSKDAVALTTDAVETDGGRLVTAPMPGIVSAVNTAAGEQVARGDTLVVIEAMKLMHSLGAPNDGVVVAVNCTAGDTVEGGEVLAEIDPGET